MLIEDRPLERAVLQFIFPFAYKRGSDERLILELLADRFVPFRLDDLSQERAFYGPRYGVSHQALERYFMPYSCCILFPRSASDQNGFRRYAKTIGKACTLRTERGDMPFRLHAAEVIVCPFDLGFITLRIELAHQDLSFGEALEFADRFRVLQDVSTKDKRTSVLGARGEFTQTEDFIFREIVRSLLPHLDNEVTEGAYFETLPFFIDERMYVQSLFQFKEEAAISDMDLFRALHLDGLDEAGDPYASAGNAAYMAEYVHERRYDRWAPRTRYAMNENAFACLTQEGDVRCERLATQLFGEHYYGVLMSLFHKIALLKLANQYSHLNVERDHRSVQRLIRQINAFSAKYYFSELAANVQGSEMFLQLRRVFGSHALFEDVKETLADLFRYQENYQAKGQNNLLLILTLYTVVGGIYGMNQVIEDLKGDIDWSKLAEYSVFEYIALFITLTGLIVGIALAVIVAFRWVSERRAMRDK
ncbi:hypothetical protein [Paenibacillus methanolicus]|uniref:Uncharacterized protein n=1 Tax=Paenibacillus methanolicus TaxID=582686 RepID=A0A5S5CMH7_9BACL|nr:hypothetical protein [Paenibacillus methanolicus]TYP79845.1 hypothetical protein BCM02_101966 [Paenibacillus methanolicus]